MSLLSRYIKGEREAVWQELATLDTRKLSLTLERDARAVAKETMQRARHNVEILYERLSSIGFEFDAPTVPEPQREPTALGEVTFVYQAFAPTDPQEVAHYLPRVGEVCGPLPLSLEAWYECVGSVIWMGDHPELCGYKVDVVTENEENVLSDPLCVYPLPYSLTEYDCDLLRADGGPVTDFIFPVSPDLFYKHRMEGEGYEGIHVPCRTVDAVFTLTDEPFVCYLRRSFEWGGFPGWRKYAVRPEALLNHLRGGLLPI